MYSYYEYGTFAICIMQKADEEYVYYYPDFNFIKTSEYTWTRDINESVNNSFSEESIANLKELNDFDKEFDETKCIKTAIFRKIKYPKISRATEKQLETLCTQFAKDSGYKVNYSVYNYALFCTSDNYGRMLFYIYGSHQDKKGNGITTDPQYSYFHFAIIFNPDWSFDETDTLLELTDVDNYQNDLKEFKQMHNWNQPL